jgi:hypothetical protein
MLDSVVFSLIFSEFVYVAEIFYVPNFFYVFMKNIEKVWDIEKFCNKAK